MNRTRLMAVLLAVLAVVLPAYPQSNRNNGRMGIPILDNPQEILADEADSRLAASMASSKVVGQTFSATVPVFPTARGWTVENRPLEKDVQESVGFAELAQKYPLTAQRMQQEQEQQRLRLIAGISAGQTAVGQHGVYDANWVKRTSEQRQEERANTEVNQGSMPPTGSIQRSAVTCETSYTMTGYKIGQEWGYELFRGQFLLSVVYRDTTSGQVIATFTNTVERTVALRGITGNEYSYPVLPAALDVNLAVFARQLKEAVLAADTYVKANQGRVPFKFTNGYAWLTLGRSDGLVGSNDGARVAGSRVKISGAGHAFIATVYQTGESTAFLSVDGLTTADQELLGQNPVAQIVRDGDVAPTSAQPATPVPVPAASANGRRQVSDTADVPEIGAPPAAVQPGESVPTPTPVKTLAEQLANEQCDGVLADAEGLIAASYRSVTVDTTNQTLPDPPADLRWLRVTSPQASTWAPGTVISATQLAADNTVVVRFRAIVVTATGEKALVWMPTTADTTRAGDWVIQQGEPLVLSLSTATLGAVIAVPNLDITGAAPIHMRWVDVHPAWFGGVVEPATGLVIELHREVQGQTPVIVKAVVVGKGESVRCAYALPAQAFDRTWKVVVQPTATPTPEPAPTATPAPEPTPTPKPTGEQPAGGRDTVVTRFLAAAQQTPLWGKVDAELPPFRTGADVQNLAPPAGVRMAPVIIPMAERGKWDIGYVVPFTREVDGKTETVRAVVMAHIKNAENAAQCVMYVWLLDPAPGKGWHLAQPDTQ